MTINKGSQTKLSCNKTELKRCSIIIIVVVVVICYICINSRWRSSLCDVRAFRGADVGSDHNLVIANIRLRFKKTQLQKAAKPIATDKLKDPRVSERYYVDVSNRFSVSQHANDFSEQWQLFQDTVKESAEIVLGRRRGFERTVDHSGLMGPDRRPGSSRILVDSPSKKINLARRRKKIQASQKFILQVK